MSIAGKAMKITTNTLQEMKEVGEKITMLTAYDFSTARILDGAGIDVILVGDSASNVMAGNDTTVPITLDHMIYHAQCVVKAVNRALIVCDMPFGSYQGDSKQALKKGTQKGLSKSARRIPGAHPKLLPRALWRTPSSGSRPFSCCFIEGPFKTLGFEASLL